MVGGAIAALIYVILFRITLEFYYAVVRMSEDIRGHAQPLLTRGGSGTVAA